MNCRQCVEPMTLHPYHRISAAIGRVDVCSTYRDINHVQYYNLGKTGVCACVLLHV